ncbi:MAG: hypothetical protein HYZ04_00515, partial [Rhodospirillales bacterium]|nr:hypothetical protein [Rhodospirillales bacterium]
DAAALAGAYELAEDRATNIGTVAQREAENNGWTDCAGGCITIRSSPFNGTFPAAPSAYSADAETVQVALTRQVSLLFAGYFLGSGNSVTINTKAVGKAVAGATTACVLALGSGNPSGALTVSGASNSVTMSGCTMATNSTNDNAVKNLTGTMSADCVYSAGGIQGTPGPTTTACASPGKSNQPAVTDPYATITEPTVSDCGSNSYSLTGAGNSDTISAGTYCSISVNANNGTLTLNAGTYFIDQGDFTVTSNNSTVNATAGVTIVFGDSSGGGNCGRLNIAGAGTVNITAPTTGTLAGIAFYRGPSCDAGSGMTLTGSSGSTIIGALYAPTSSLSMSGGTSVAGSCLQLIADTISFTGTGTIGSDCDGTGVKDILAGGKGSLVE